MGDWVGFGRATAFGFFQHRGFLLIWKIEGQEPTVFGVGACGVGAGWECFYIYFARPYHIFSLSLSLSASI